MYKNIKYLIKIISSVLAMTKITRNQSSYTYNMNKYVIFISASNY